MAKADGGEGYYRAPSASILSISLDVSERAVRSRVMVLEKAAAKMEELGVLERHKDALGMAYHILARKILADSGASADKAVCATERSEPTLRPLVPRLHNHRGAVAHELAHITFPNAVCLHITL